jgi:hypothetical protein
MKAPPGSTNAPRRRSPDTARDNLFMLGLLGAAPVTLDLIEAYKRWLELELWLLAEEFPSPIPIRKSEVPPRPSMAGWSTGDISKYLLAEQVLLRHERNMMEASIEQHAKFRNFQFLAASSAEQRPAAGIVDRFYLDGDRVVSPPPSTRAASVLSIVGCDWRA